ncbi:MAG: hypothetical protein E7A11_18325 [Clostridium sp.]|uniref:hypothetical protein n=1 Tax=Clostridium TaxID=1485 RepID=UPI000C071F53|nr:MULTISPECIES: hypothetical protein [Clostridium]MBS6887620.1 hypothetical protein [Clostridium sp.]MBS7131874.1 hypothetical protein [Clostridium sp.]MDB2104923.1 hypothetical protein [Clostridium paraputrificum]MDU1127209.1 hypothetical protein [Clostridium sp.]MDU2284184.1 hypothetical protein [Clostridium sp.]
MNFKKNIITKLPLMLSLLGIAISMIHIKGNSIGSYITNRVPDGILSIPLFFLSIHLGNKVNDKSFFVSLGILISKFILALFFIGIIVTLFMELF